MSIYLLTIIAKFTVKYNTSNYGKQIGIIKLYA